MNECEDGIVECEDGIVEEICGGCNGSGEGSYSGSTCTTCHGSGDEKRYCSCEKGREHLLMSERHRE